MPDLEYVTVETLQDGRLKIIIDSDKEKRDRTAMRSQARDELAEKFKGLQMAEAKQASKNEKVAA